MLSGEITLRTLEQTVTLETGAACRVPADVQRKLVTGVLPATNDVTAELRGERASGSARAALPQQGSFRRVSSTNARVPWGNASHRRTRRRNAARARPSSRAYTNQHLRSRDKQRRTRISYLELS